MQEFQAPSQKIGTSIFLENDKEGSMVVYM